MNQESDEMLMLEYGKGNAQAFDALYARYREPLYRYFLRHVHNPASANDLYQGCWEKVINARSKYSDDAPFRAWLFRIAHNHMMDFFRANRPTEEFTDDTDFGIDESNPAATEIDEDAQRSALHTAISNLSDEQRDAVLLKLESGLSLEEIAHVAGVGTETLKSRLRYAMKKLRKELKS